jgi:anthranilate 1,2-dioxygenase small subunit
VPRISNVYEPQRYLHQISGLTIELLDDHRVKCRPNYLVVRTMGDGTMTLYSAGVYLDKVVLNGDSAQFEERIVVPDSRRIETLLVIPL